MLPNMTGLALEAHKAAPTAEFYTLNKREVRALKKERINEIYSQHTPKAGNGDMFRIANNRKADPRAVEDHSWCDGLQLWAWAKDHELDLLRKPWWQEDWVALRNRYDPQFTSPEWVKRLPRLLSDAGRAAGARKLSVGDYAGYPSGPDNRRPAWPHFEENVTWVRDEIRRGWGLYVNGAQRYAVLDAQDIVYYYEGPRDEEHKVKEDHPGDQLQFYEGPKGEEHAVRVEFSYGPIQFYEGPKGEERLVKYRGPGGIVILYEGRKREEHKVKIELPSGQLQFYEGPQHEERLVRSRNPDGVLIFYEGPKDEEAKVKVELPSGQVHLYEGPKGEERLVRIVNQEGHVVFYEGPRDEEHKVRVAAPGGVSVFYEGPKNEEHMVRVSLLNGHVIFYEGPQGEERVALAKTVAAAAAAAAAAADAQLGAQHSALNLTAKD